MVRMRKQPSALAAIAVCVGAAAAAVRPALATDAPATSRATLVRPAAGGHGPAVGTAVRLSEVLDIAFATPRVGYALGGPFGSRFPLKTTDGGRNWFIDGPAFFLPVADGAAAVDDMWAASANESYAYGGPGGGSSIAITTDAGRHWWRAWLGQALLTVSQRGSDLWALAAGSTSSAAGNSDPPVLLYDSANGGRSWTYRSTLIGVRGWEADLARPSLTTAFALVNGFGSEHPADAGIVETTNGGATWTKLTDPCSNSRFDFTERLAAPSTTSLWLFCGGQPSTGIQAKLVERSSDAGRSWTLVAADTPGQHVPSNDIPLTGELPAAGATGYVSVTSPSDAWLILTGSDVLWKTTDGGQIWTDGAPSTIEAQFPQQLSLTDGSLFVKSQNALWEHPAASWTLVAGTSKPY